MAALAGHPGGPVDGGSVQRFGRDAGGPLAVLRFVTRYNAFWQDFGSGHVRYTRHVKTQYKRF